jgi:hypothetical protein
VRDYDERWNVSGHYRLVLYEGTCQAKSAATRSITSYDLDGKSLHRTYFYNEPLSLTLPETRGRNALEIVCRISQTGVTQADLGFDSIPSAIEAFKAFLPPR